MDLEKSNNIEIIDVEYTKDKLVVDFLAFIVRYIYFGYLLLSSFFHF